MADDKKVLGVAQPGDTLLSVKVPAGLKVELARRARANERTVSGETRIALSRHLAAAGRERPS